MVPDMYEFDSVSVSTYEASSLASKLTEKSGDGWDVVAIVPSGSEITAFLKRAGSGAESASTDTAVSAADAPVVAAAVDTPSEPSGWGTAPESSVGSSSWGSTGGDASSTSSWGTGASTTQTDNTGGWGATAAPAVAPAAPATPSVPAGWYADPANRYELRYWDGTAWTEHVSRAGQQYTDPPVA